MNFLLIEDDEEKEIKIVEYVDKNYINSNIIIARSFSSGLKAIVKNWKSIDVLLLDMSMPNFDVSAQEPGGGTPENFAGAELLAQMQLRGINVPTIVITMFDFFGDGMGRKSFKQLEAELSEKFGPNFRGMVYFNAAQEGWQSNLKLLIESSI